MSRRKREDDFGIPEDEAARRLRLGRPKLSDHPLVQGRPSSRARNKVAPWSKDRKVGRKKGQL